MVSSGDRYTVWSLELLANKRFASVNDSTVVIWSSESFERVQTFRGHEDAVFATRLLTNSGQLATGSRDRTIKVWDMTSGACLRAMVTDETVTALEQLPGYRLACGSYGSGSGVIRIWNMNSGECLQRLSGH